MRRCTKYVKCKVMKQYFRSFREKLDKENISIIQSVEPQQQQPVSQVFFFFSLFSLEQLCSGALVLELLREAAKKLF